jgi:hypothetical protein
MGFQKVNTLESKDTMAEFVRHLLDDVRAFEHMLENDWFVPD